MHRESVRGDLSADDYTTERGVVDLKGCPPRETLAEMFMLEHHPHRRVGASEIFSILAQEGDARNPERPAEDVDFLSRVTRHRIVQL
jgi:acyl-CoA hydrolase